VEAILQALRSYLAGEVGVTNARNPSHALPSPRLDASPLGRVVEGELIPRLLLAHRVGPISPQLGGALGGVLSDHDVAEFVRRVLGGDDEEVPRYIAGLLERGTTAEALYLDLLAPTARQIGDLWSDDRCDFVEVTLALGRLQRALRDLSRVFLADATRPTLAGRVLLSSVPGEQHTLGMFMVAEFLLRDGWGVFVGPPLSEAELLASVESEWFDVIGFSVGCESRLQTLKREITKVRRCSRNRQVAVMVGGRVFNDYPELIGRVGADASAIDAREAPLVARALLHEVEAGSSEQRRSERRSERPGESTQTR
jgi:methanogenic corrinoid protein MtbC1